MGNPPWFFIAAGAVVSGVAIFGRMGKKCNRRSGIHSKIGAGCLPKADRALLAETEAFVKKELHAQDGSHDWFHIHRVRNLALKLARMEGINNRLVVELAALLHDIRDWKYSGDENEGIVEVEKFLGSKNCPKCVTEQVLHIVKNIGFKNELAAERANGDSKLIITPELAVVQDADRLDAIEQLESLELSRNYGGSRNRALYDPDIKPCINITKEQYMKKGRNEPTINHFYEKLLKLKTKMKSKSGRQVAEGRHKYMEEYLEKFCREWSGEE